MANQQNKLVTDLFDKLKKDKISVPRLAQLVDIPKDRIYKWKQEGTNPKAEDEKIIRKWLNGESVEVVPREKMEENNDLNLQTIHELAQSNRELAMTAKIQAEKDKIQAETDKIRAEKEKLLIQSNSHLSLLLQPTDYRPEANPLDHPSILSALLQTLAELGIGKYWGSKEEGLVELGNRFALPGDEAKRKAHTRVDGGRKSTA